MCWGENQKHIGRKPDLPPERSRDCHPDMRLPRAGELMEPNPMRSTSHLAA